MALLAILGGLLLCVAFAVRELQLGRERAALLAAIEQLRASLELTRQHLRRATEDLFILSSLLTEHNVLDDEELARARARLIDAPRQKAEERATIARDLNVSPTQLLLEENDKVH